MSEEGEEQDGVSRFCAASDGLRLHWRDHGVGSPFRPPVVCLPGLARTAADFEALARRLSPRRRVLRLDYRGRGLSARDPDWRRYALPVELDDVLAVLREAAISRAIFVGTSRGGLHLMALAGLRPEMLAAAVLNDIGPVIETEGIERIRSYVGRIDPPRDWAEAVSACRRRLGPRFCGLSQDEIEAYARLTFEETEAGLRPRYDPNLANVLAEMKTPLPDLWPQFEALAPVPLLAIRGENSDLLSAATLADMARRHPDCRTFTTPGQGHAPLLLDEPTLARIEAFVEEIEARS